MGIEDAFLHDVLAHPDDDAPRLIYADWLDERNVPRGEFIRIQCALAQLSDEDPRRWPLELREQELLSEHETKWLPKGIGKDPCVFHRGFVEGITLSPADFLADADCLFEQAPIRRLRLDPRGWQRVDNPNPSLTHVADSQHLARLQALSLCNLTLSRRELREFLAAPHFRQLAELQFLRLIDPNSNQLLLHPDTQYAEIVGDLIELPCWTSLRSLNLANTGMAPGVLRLLANASSAVSLRELNLNGNSLTHGAASILAEGCLLHQLETLHLNSNLLGDTGALMVREWPALPCLSRLSLGHNQIFAGGVQALAEAQALRELISLDLSGNIACDPGAVTLASSGWTRLQALNLRFNGVGDKGVQALARSEALSHLTRLDLTANHVTSVGARALIESPYLRHLARLDLLRNDIGEAEQQGLRDRYGRFIYF